MGKPEPFVDDPLTELLRRGARKLLAEAQEIEIELFLDQYKPLRDENGKMRVIRNGYLPEREIQTGIGPVKVRAPRIRDRKPGKTADGVRFNSPLLPRYLRKTKSMAELLTWLYLKGVSTGDFQDALFALVEKDAPGLSAATVSRLKAIWQQDYEQWRQQDLPGKRNVYFWADGVYSNVRMDEKQCLLGPRLKAKKSL